MDRYSMKLATGATGLLLAFLALGYSARAVPIDLTPVAGGAVLRDLVPKSGDAVVLVLAPDECLQCMSSLSKWTEWRRRLPRGRVVLLLSREPTESERTQLRLHRIQVDGTLRRRISIDALSGLHLLWYRDQQLVQSRSEPQAGADDSVLLAALNRARP